MLQSFVLAALVGASSVLGVTCSIDKKCPEDLPCCSQYGECGVGAFCLGGCDPRTSHSLDSCMPSPVCKDKELKFDTMDNMKHISEYLGDGDEADWVVTGEATQHNDNVLLTMPRGSVGTVVSSTSYMWYGNVKVRMRTSRGRGVVTGFILFSDVKDEIDYEWVGVDLETAQTNFYHLGIPNYENSGNISLSNTFSQFHDYEIRWTPDKIEWYVDGQKGRVQERKDTWNETSQNWAFPQTPSRVQLSLWPGGLESNPEGTISWAGGVIDWDHEDVKNVGYFYSTLESITMECYNKDDFSSEGGKSYHYDDLAGTNETVVVGDRDTVLGSLQATGLDPDKGKKKDDDEDDDDDDRDLGETIPGGSSSGAPGHDHKAEDDDSDSSNGNNNNNGGGGGGGDDGLDRPPSNAGDCPPGEFCQGLDVESEESNGNGGDSSGSQPKASVLAIVIAGCALYWL